MLFAAHYRRAWLRNITVYSSPAPPEISAIRHVSCSRQHRWCVIPRSGGFKKFLGDIQEYLLFATAQQKLESRSLRSLDLNRFAVSAL